MKGPIVAVAIACCTFCSLLSCAPAVNETSFRFEWPVPSEATVQVEFQQDDDVSRVKYSVNVSSGDTPDEILLHFRDVEFLQIGAADLSDSIVRVELAPLLAMAAALPPFVLSSSGQFLRIEDWDRMVEEVFAALRDLDPAANDAVLEHISRLMTHPDTRQKLQISAARDWNLWVTAWNGHRLRRGIPLEFDYSMALPVGGEAQAHATLTYLPASPENPELHRVRLRTECTGSDFREAMIRTLESMLPRDELTDDKRAEMRAAIGRCTLITETEAVTDPSTLVPSTVTSTRTTRIDGNQGDGQVRIEIRKYTFDWH